MIGKARVMTAWVLRDEEVPCPWGPEKSRLHSEPDCLREERSLGRIHSQLIVVAIPWQIFASGFKWIDWIEISYDFVWYRITLSFLSWCGVSHVSHMFAVVTQGHLPRFGAEIPRSHRRAAGRLSHSTGHHRGPAESHGGTDSWKQVITFANCSM